ncbi:hypothetical protein [Streptomyces sp. NBC_01477]|uniref:hypothetical protein n=1 Tax=Streptomyces sp. NBC_01477 TaxID=2976015 RepID=UPI002E3092A9|nr:hypothetical protein [Streptomyces sp. NBC_01477]
MAEDEVRPRPTHVSRLGPLGAGYLYAASAVMCLCGPVVLACTAFAGAGLLVTGILFTVVLLPLGLGIRGSARADREDNRRLDTAGVAATAEVTGLTEWDDGEEAGLLVDLRISGPDFRTFEATWKRSRHPALRVGLRLAAVVDPAGGLYRVEW